jgi:hypothetical protein
MADANLERFAEAAWSALLDHVGSDQAITGADLCRKIHLVDRRDVPLTRDLRLVVHYARVHLKRPICSLPGQGYFRPRDTDELDHTYRVCRRTAIQQMHAVATLRKLCSQQVRSSDGWMDELIEREGLETQRELFTGV